MFKAKWISQFVVETTSLFNAPTARFYCFAVFVTGYLSIVIFGAKHEF
jgi:hypothetical protein